MDAAEPTMPDTSPPPRNRPWHNRQIRLGILSLIAAAVLLHLGLVGYLLFSGTIRHWHGAELEVQGARASVSGSDLMVTRSGRAPTLILTAMKRPFQEAFDASMYDRVAVEIDDAPSALGVVLLWTIQDQPDTTHSQPLRRDPAGRHAIGLAGHPQWQGRVIGLGFAITGDEGRPVTVRSLAVMPRGNVGVGHLLTQIWREWVAFEGWGWHSVNFVVGGVQGPIVSLVGASAIWVLLAIGVYLVLARRHGGDVSVAVAAALFLAGWLILDLRWQADLWQQNLTTIRTFAGKSWNEKRASDWDGDLFQAIDDARRRMGDEPKRLIVFYGVRDESVAYLTYHAIPHNALVTFPPPTIEDFRPGDYLLVLAPTPEVDYRPLDRSVIWPGERGLNALPADPVHVRPQASVLFRVREH